MPRPDATANWSGGCTGGRASGTGTLILRSGEKETQRYVGAMRGDTPNGQGVYTYAEGTRYEGEVRNGDANGRG
jgi:hypothetical protein